MIRPAASEDYKAVAPLFILAMGHIAGIFAGSGRNEDAIPFFEDFFRRDDNQYSYKNTLVYEEDGQIMGSVTGYDGARLHALRQPVLDQIRMRQPSFAITDETEAGEYYLDCINVDARFQGRGIGKKLINCFCEMAFARNHNRVGLIVDFENSAAKKFYEKLHFQVAGEKKFMGHRYFHMVRDFSKNR
jgi:ribosomal protein S18 acetylase RimI-like enzyme